MDAIVKAFEKLEKREERKKEAQSKHVHDNPKKVPEVKMKKEKEVRLLVGIQENKSVIFVNVAIDKL